MANGTDGAADRDVEPLLGFKGNDKDIRKADKGMGSGKSGKSGKGVWAD